MQRLFSSFPSGQPGRGLLLLRLTLAICLTVDGSHAMARSVATPSGAGAAVTWVFGGALIVCSVLIVLGLVTPLAQAVIAVAGASALGDRLWSLAPPSAMTGPWQLLLLEIALSVGLIMLGPGAYSLDSRLFGRQEINIPFRPPVRGPRADGDPDRTRAE